MESVVDTQQKVSISRHLWRLARPYWLHLGSIFLLSLIAAPIALLLALPLKIVVDNVIGNLPLPHVLQRLLPAWAAASKDAHLFLAVGLMLTFSLLMNLQGFAAWLLQTYTGEKLVLDFRSQLFWHVQRMDLQFHDRRGTNELAYRIQHDAPAIQYIFLQGFVPIVSSVLTFVTMLYVTARIDWVLALIALLLSPALLLLARQSSRRARRGWDGVKRLDSSAMVVLHEVLASIRVVKAFGQEKFEDNRFRLRSRQRMGEQLKVASGQAIFHVMITTTVTLGTVMAMLVGTRHVIARIITLGDFLLVMAYMSQLYEPLRTISAKLPELQSWIINMQRALALLEGAPEVVEAPHAVALTRAQGHFTFRDVSFEYPTSGRGLKQISLEIPAGARVGIIGPSGSGKSTLVNLLTRFYDPCSGEILLDGRDLRGYNLEDLRRQFAIVLQEPVVFSATAAENISYADPGASREDVVAAAKAAHADEFIRALPDGYDTRIGDGGCCLSGGERQRLAIARAFLKNAPVLILDEPTSAIDMQTEREILQATENLVRGRTTFVIAHRPNTVRHCDLLLVLKKGVLQTMTQDFQTAMRAADEEPQIASKSVVPFESYVVQ
jgi:ATP-binding cassette subfamily B protein